MDAEPSYPQGSQSCFLQHDFQPGFLQRDSAAVAAEDATADAFAASHTVHTRVVEIIVLHFLELF